MKILLIKNRYKKKINLKRGLEYIAKNTPLKIEIEEIFTDFDLSFKKVSNSSFKASQNVVPTGYYDKLRNVVPDGKYDAVCLYYGNDAPGIRVSFAENDPLYPNTDVIVVVKDSDSGDTFSHELLHLITRKLARKGIFVPDVMDKAGSNGTYTATQNRDEQIKLLAPYWNFITDFSKPIVNKPTIVKKKDLEWSYKWFNLLDDPKMLGVEHELMVKLDAIRDEAGFPMVITSGKRTKAENDALKDSASNSGHLRGFEVDIACTDSAKRDRIIELSYKHGITRRGIGKDFIHLGIDPSLPQHVMWHYYK